MARIRVPSKAASGLDSFSDNLVGRQITDGSSALTNTNFAIDRVIPEKDAKVFKTNQFSDYVSMEDLKVETNATTGQSTQEKKSEIRFNSSKDDGSVSLFGSLKNGYQYQLLV